MQNDRNRNLLLVLIAAVVLILCCCCAVIGVGGALLAMRAPSTPGAETVKVVTRMVTATPSVPRVTPTPPAAGQSPDQPEAGATVVDGGQVGEVNETGEIPPLDAESAALLANAMPAADARDLALRFDPDGGDIPIVVNAIAAQLSSGRQGAVLGLQQRYAGALPGDRRVALPDRPRGDVGRAGRQVQSKRPGGVGQPLRAEDLPDQPRVLRQRVESRRRQ